MPRSALIWERHAARTRRVFFKMPVSKNRRLSRSFRFYAKKRGDRRTGSPKAGTVGLALFFAGLFLTGAGLVSFAIWTAAGPAGMVGYVWLLALLSAPFVFVGGAGLSYQLYNWWTSAEQRSVVARQTAELTPFEPLHRRGEFSYVPTDFNIANSPGTRLSFRLPAAASDAWALAALMVACLLWNSMACVLVALAATDLLYGQAQWLLVAVAVVFAAVGVFLIVVCYRRTAQAVRLGRTLMEISDHPLYPGRQYKVFLAQSGRLRLSTLRLLLVCEECVTYQQGTNARTESRRVQEHEIYCANDITIRPETPSEIERHLIVPTGAMHSFRGAQNEIRWRLVVSGEMDGGPEFQRSFPVIINPPGKAVPT